MTELYGVGYVAVGVRSVEAVTTNTRSDGSRLASPSVALFVVAWSLFFLYRFTGILRRYWKVRNQSAVFIYSPAVRYFYLGYIINNNAMDFGLLTAVDDIVAIDR